MGRTFWLKIEERSAPNRALVYFFIFTLVYYNRASPNPAVVDYVKTLLECCTYMQAVSRRGDKPSPKLKQKFSEFLFWKKVFNQDQTLPASMKRRLKAFPFIFFQTDSTLGEGRVIFLCSKNMCQNVRTLSWCGSGPMASSPYKVPTILLSVLWFSGLKEKEKPLTVLTARHQCVTLWLWANRSCKNSAALVCPGSAPGADHVISQGQQQQDTPLALAGKQSRQCLLSHVEM